VTSSLRFYPLSALIAVLFLPRFAALDAAQQISEDRELKELDLTAWNCANRLGGSGRSPETVERNQLKNRWTVDLAGLAVKTFDTAGLLNYVADFDAQAKGKRRKDLSPEEKRRLEILQGPIVSLTGYLGLAYAGPPETTNCSSVDFHDWHLEIFEEALDHPPQPGDPTPIICEITPRTQNAIYRDGIRIQEIAAFFRLPDVTYESTGHKAQKVRVTGYLLWDDEHNDTKDVGATIHSIARNKYHNPWRATAWEIHPVIKIERLDGAMPQTAGGAGGFCSSIFTCSGKGDLRAITRSSCGATEICDDYADGENQNSVRRYRFAARYEAANYRARRTIRHRPVFGPDLRDSNRVHRSAVTQSKSQESQRRNPAD
jgi:hypothetical protein